MLADLKLSDCYDGLFYLGESIRYLPQIQSHHHAELEWNLVVQGTITYVMNGHRFTFPPRTQLWLFPNQEHQLVDRSNNARFYVVAFKPSLIDKACKTDAYEGLKHEPETQDLISNTVLDPKSFAFVCGIMDSLMQGALDSDLLNKECGFGPTSNFHFEHHDPDALNAGLHYLLLLCWRNQFSGKATPDVVALHPAVRRALRLLSEADTEQDLDALARSCGASKSYLSRLFHRQIGIPLIRYRNSLLLSRFFEQYRQPDQKTITEAVYAAGFGSYAQFYKIFVQAYGCGPRSCFARELRKK